MLNTIGLFIVALFLRAVTILIRLLLIRSPQNFKQLYIWLQRDLRAFFKVGSPKNSLLHVFKFFFNKN